MIAYTLTNNSITVVLNNKVYTVSNGQPQWEPTLEAIRNNDEKALLNVLSVASAITSFTEGHVTVKDNQVFYRNVPLDNYVVGKVLDFARNKLPLQPILRFINKLMENPSQRAVQELYKFLEHKQMPLTPEGNFLAYKGVQNDFYSITAGNIIVTKGKVEGGKIYNGVGEEIEVVRNGVCDDKNVGCSSGLHAGSLQYATDFGRQGKVVIVEINPAYVVSVPDDCKCQKLRTCKYKVVGLFEVPLNDHYNNNYSKEDWNNNINEDAGEESYEETHEDYFNDPENCSSVDDNNDIDHPFDVLFREQISEVEQNVQKVIVNTADTLRAFANKLDKAPAPTVANPNPNAELTTNITDALNTLRDAITKHFGK